MCYVQILNLILLMFFCLVGWLLFCVCVKVLVSVEEET